MSDKPATDLTQRIQLLHDWYGRAMGTSLPLGPSQERYWFDFFKAGYNGKQLRRVMNWLRREIAAGRRNPGSLKLRNLLDPETFGEDLILANSKLDPEIKLPPTPPSERIPYTSRAA